MRAGAGGGQRAGAGLTGDIDKKGFLLDDLGERHRQNRVHGRAKRRVAHSTRVGGYSTTARPLHGRPVAAQPTLGHCFTKCSNEW